MEESVKNNLLGNKRWPWWVFSIIIFLFVLLIVGFLSLLVNLPEKVIARGITIGQIDLGGLTKEQAEKIIVRQVEMMENQGIFFNYKNISLNLTSVGYIGIDPEISPVVFDYDVEKTINQALALGRQGNIFNQFSSRVYLRLFGHKIEPVYFLSSEGAFNFLKSNLSEYETPIKNASLQVVDFETLKINVLEEAEGKIFDYETAINELKDRLRFFDPSKIVLQLKNIQPEIVQNQAEEKIEDLKNALVRGDIIFKSDGKEFKVNVETWWEWVVLHKINGQIVLDINEDLLKKYLSEKILLAIESDFEEAKFVVENGKVKEFKPGKAGKKINIEGTAETVKEALFALGDRQITLVLEVFQPEMNLAKVNTYGIKELLGVGHSNFQGSPVNRRKNIAVGAAILHGILIAPGEVFSTVEKLKPFDDSNGYLPELVIKGNKTVPEYGGGLCQISTTLFRSVLESGLPVTERASHAYRVSYYEPPVGLDATIYDPAPDFKFVNDTGNYILVQSKIDGDNLYFEFWGTKDGRTIKRTEPKIFNIKAPPSSKLIETLDLPVGQKKCTEKARSGADASFEYTVIYPDGLIKNQEFKSRYRPWGEVCMIGVEKLTEPEVDELIPTPENEEIVAPAETPVIN